MTVQEVALYVIAATYGHGRHLFYAGPADVEHASRSGVHRFTSNPRGATVFTRWPTAMRASWRASPPRRRDRWALERLQIQDLEPAA